MKTRKLPNFRERVLHVVSGIPKGETLSYKDVASRAGNPGAARAVGTIMKANADRRIPCHRVVRADGKPSGYNGLRGASRAALLKRERASANR